MHSDSGYVLTVWDAKGSHASQTEDRATCSIIIDIEDPATHDGSAPLNVPPPGEPWEVDPWREIDEPPSSAEAPLLLTVGREFIRRLFSAAIEAGRTCRIDLGPTIDRPFDPPTMCRTAEDIDSWLNRVTVDIGTEAHDDVYPIHVWVLPAVTEDAASSLISRFWEDPDSDEAYHAILDSGVVRASLAPSSCNLNQQCMLRDAALDWVREASHNAGLPVHWN